METVEVKLGKNTIKIPKLFQELCNFIKSDMTAEGIFRVEGSKVKQKRIIKSLDQSNELPSDATVIDTSATMKAFLRNLPDSLIHKDCEEWFLKAGKLESNMSDAILLVILLLPLEHIYLLAFLMQFFQEVTTFSSKNKMDSYNMAVVISPSIFPQNNIGNVESTSVACTVTKVMIENAKYIGEVPDKIIQKFDELIAEQNKSKPKFKLFACS